ncbi:hypothetical protein MMC24_004106 [Lignoscripta atroalba]|nr:hypothetical protein [Lignoscripta atroalba]
MSTYKPTEHGGLKEDGTPDKRVGTGAVLFPGTEFAQGKVDPVEAGKQGGATSGSGSGSGSDSGSGSGGENYKPTEHGGLKEDGTTDGRVGTGSKPFPFSSPTFLFHFLNGWNRLQFLIYVTNAFPFSSFAEFAHGKVDPVEAGSKGGSTS